MKIGLIQYYPWRPHIEHMMVVADLLIKDGHSVFFLTCDGNVEMCYQRKLKKGMSKIRACTQCQLAGVKSYYSKNIQLITKQRSNSVRRKVKDIPLSSVYTLLRIEDDHERESKMVNALRESLIDACEKSYASTVNLLKENKLDGLIIFNARIDMLASSAKAAEDSSIPYISIERSVSNYGIMMKYNENCLGLNCLGEMISSFRDKALTRKQCAYVVNHIAARFISKNENDYRIFNTSPTASKWPFSTKRPKVLITPSSKCEFLGDCQNDIRHDIFSLIEKCLEELKLTACDCVVREHPNWATKFSDASTNESAKNIWRTWCKNNNIFIIEAESNLSTYDLIESCDILFCNGSSTAMEAGICGKKIVCFGPSTYLESGFVNTVIDENDINDIKIQPKSHIIQRCMRYIYTTQVRFPQYSRLIQPINNMAFQYSDRLSAKSIIDIFKNKKIMASDADYDKDQTSELKSIEKINECKWSDLYDESYVFNPDFLYTKKIKRRFIYRWIDFVARKMKPSEMNH